MLLPERALSKIALTQIILETRIGHKNMFHCFCYLEGCHSAFRRNAVGSRSLKLIVYCSSRTAEYLYYDLRTFTVMKQIQRR